MLRIESPPALLPPLPGPMDDFAVRIRTRLGLRSCWFESFPFAQLLPRLEPDRVVLPAGEPGARSYAEWQPEDGIELPVRHRSLLLGRFVLVTRQPSCGVAIPAAEREDAIEIARRASVALARQWIAWDRPRKGTLT